MHLMIKLYKSFDKAVVFIHSFILNVLINTFVLHRTARKLIRDVYPNLTDLFFTNYIKVATFK